MIKATISKINPSLGYGFAKSKIAGPIFFSKDSLQDPGLFDKIAIGDIVELEPVESERGLTTSKVVVSRLESPVVSLVQ